MFTLDHFKTDADVRMLMFIHQHLFETQGNFDIVARVLLTLSVCSCFFPDMLLNIPSGLNFINSGSE